MFAVILLTQRPESLLYSVGVSSGANLRNCRYRCCNGQQDAIEGPPGCQGETPPMRSCRSWVARSIRGVGRSALPYVQLSELPHKAKAAAWPLQANKNGSVPHSLSGTSVCPLLQQVPKYEGRRRGSGALMARKQQSHDHSPSSRAQPISPGGAGRIGKTPRGARR